MRVANIPLVHTGTADALIRFIHSLPAVLWYVEYSTVRTRSQHMFCLYGVAVTGIYKPMVGVFCCAR
jgi:hypothetical protein